MKPRLVSELFTQLAAQAGDRLEFHPIAQDELVGPAVVSDHRNITEGAVFIAIKGERVDGYDFIPAAREAGAALVVTNRLAEIDVAQIVVADPLLGLAELAKLQVNQSRAEGVKVIAITGSSGKTSVKDILAQVMAQAGPTIAPPGSFNNELGAPLTACQITAETKFLISEMGSRGLGHIERLTSFIQPDISVIGNIGTAHLGEFGSVETIQQAKSELISALPDTGWAVLNADNELVAGISDKTSANIIWFSQTGDRRPEFEHVLWASDISSDAMSRYSFTLNVRHGSDIENYPCTLQLVGHHQVENALAAAGAALCAGMSAEEVAQALSQAQPMSAWRMELHHREDGVLIINDAYNANPDSMKAALDSLGEIQQQKRKFHPEAKAVAILGDMLELGEAAIERHEELGRIAAQVADLVICIGQHAPDIAQGVTQSGKTAVIKTKEQAVSDLTLNPGDVVLIKASRGLGLEDVAATLLSSADDSEIKEGRP